MEKEYIIYDFLEKEIDWTKVKEAKIDSFPWYQEGEKQSTQVKCAISKNNICLKVHSKDRNIRQEARINNEAVYQDSCFEWFVTPNGQKGTAYFNIEVSCNGTLYIAYKDCTPERKLMTRKLLEKVSVLSTIGHEEWSLEIKVPIEVLEKMQEETISRVTWYGNFYRCGGKKDQQYACWNPIIAEAPNFHLPHQFGKFIIHKV